MDPFEAEGKNYQDAKNHASSLNAFGAFVKIVGYGVMLVAVLGGVSTGGMWGVAMGVAGVVAGFLLVSMGSMISAAGQLLAAIISTAVNTKVSAALSLGWKYENVQPSPQPQAQARSA